MSKQEHPFWYWIPRLTGLLVLIGLFTAATIRASDAERKTKQIPGVRWDLSLVKSLLNAANPHLYDSVLSAQVKIYGPRPTEE